MHEVLVNRLGGLSLPRKSVVRLTDRPDMTLDIYRGRKTTIQYYLMTSFYFPWTTCYRRASAKGALSTIFTPLEWRGRDLNPRPPVPEADALPLSDRVW